ncbi:hypothetical protein [Dokdonella sp.]|uniref:hypothetical protein n=1 Tax=Dokdonella sp. TaxID=2291710 RepID=UPI003263F141
MVLLFLGLVALNVDRASGLTRLICFGDRFSSTRLPDVVQSQPFVFARSDGYDGQFYAQIATRPLLDDPELARALDSPDYRSRRIGLPWLAWLAGFGYTPWVLQAYALANVLVWLALAWMLLRWIPPDRFTARLAWFGAVFGVGSMMSVARALTDLPSALLIATAILLAERGRKRSAVVALGFAALTRDTSVLAAGLLMSTQRDGWREWMRGALSAALAILPAALWGAYAHWRFPGSPQGDSANFSLPFVAMVGALGPLWRAVPQLGWHAFATQALTTIALCVQFLFLVLSARRLWHTRWWRAGAAFALLFALLGPAVWQEATAAARVVLPMTLAFNILLPRDRRWSVAVCALGNLSVLHGLAYLLPTTWTTLP